MTNAASNTSIAKSETAAQAKQVILKDVGAKWGKFSEQDLSALKGKDDLVKEVVAKYGLERGSGSARCRRAAEGSRSDAAPHDENPRSPVETKRRPLSACERFCFCRPQTDWAQLARPYLPFALRINLKAPAEAQRPIPLQDQLR